MLSRLAPRGAATIRMAVAPAVARTGVASFSSLTGRVQARLLNINRSYSVSAFRLVSAATSSAPATTSSPSDVHRPRSIVLTASGPDRAGIVAELARAVTQHNGNVEESRMTILGNDFALLLRITVPKDVTPDMLQKEVQTTFPEYMVSARDTSSAPPNFTHPVRIFSVTVEGPDQPGIVAVLSKLFVEHKASVRDLDTDSSSAPFAGYKIFSLKAIIAMPTTADFPSFEESLHKFEDTYGFDVDINEGMNEEMEEEFGQEGPEGEGEEYGEEQEQQDLLARRPLMGRGPAGSGGMPPPPMPGARRPPGSMPSAAAAGAGPSPFGPRGPTARPPPLTAPSAPRGPMAPPRGPSAGRGPSRR